jgi:hypothetical protein
MIIERYKIRGYDKVVTHIVNSSNHKKKILILEDGNRKWLKIPPKSRYATAKTIELTNN